MTSPSDEPVNVGWIIGAHGPTGQIRVRSYSDVPQRFDPGRELWVDGRSYRVQSSSPAAADQVLLRLEGVGTPAEARALAGRWLTSPAREAPALAPQEYFHFQLLGLRVRTEEGEDLGVLREILATGSNDVYLVDLEGRELLLPAISQVIRRVDLDDGIMVVKLLEGLR